jgi:hypothetical protein
VAEPIRRAAERACLVFLPALLVLVAAPAGAQTWSSIQWERQLRGERELDVRVKYGAGTVHLGAADPGHLYRARLRYDEEVFEPTHLFERGQLTLGVEGSGRRTTLRRGIQEGELDVRLSGEIPMDLHLELGAVKAEIDLGGLRLRTMELATGASDATLRVSERNPESMDRVRLQVGAASFVGRELGNLNAARFDIAAGVGEVRLDFAGLTREETRIEASMGLGSIEIRVPSNVGIRLTRSSFLSSLNAPDLERRGDVYYSADWDDARVRVRIEVDSAFGSVSVLRGGGS